MNSKSTPSRHKVVWAYGIILKYLRWYISTSEVLPLGEGNQLLKQAESVHKELLAAERKQRRFQPRSAEINRAWRDNVNDIRKQLGARPLGERKLVDELIEAILER